MPKPSSTEVTPVLGNLKISLNGAYHAFDFHKYAARYLGAFAYRFNRRFDLRTLHQRLLVAAALSGPQPQRSIRLAEVHC
jgi:hypothetical protein